jgi:hypothetical protein
MKKGLVIKLCFVLSLILTILAIVPDILPDNKSITILIIGLIISIIYVGLAIHEVATSKTIIRNEKIMWAISFIFLSWFAGLIYFVFGRKRILSKLTYRN